MNGSTTSDGALVKSADAPAQIKIAGVDDLALHKNLMHRLAAVINFLRRRCARLLC